jgi:hypothetical protein
MIPVKILTSKQAEELGLKEKKLQGRSGGAHLVGYGTLVTVNKKTKETIVHEQTKEFDGKKEITFMSDERRQYLKNTNDYINYIKAFDKIEGTDVQEEIKAVEKTQ